MMHLIILLIFAASLSIFYVTVLQNKPSSVADESNRTPSSLRQDGNTFAQHQNGSDRFANEAILSAIDKLSNEIQDFGDRLEKLEETVFHEQEEEVLHNSVDGTRPALQAREDFIASIADTYHGQETDEIFDNQVKSYLTKAFQGDVILFKSGSLSNVDCKSTICKVDVVINRGVADDDLFYFNNTLLVKFSEAGVGSGYTVDENLPDGSRSVTFYLLKDNQQNMKVGKK